MSLRRKMDLVRNEFEAQVGTILNVSSFSSHERGKN